MNDRGCRIEIERLILSGLDLNQAQAERVRALLEGELRSRLGRQGIPDGLDGGVVDKIDAPSLSVPEAAGEQRLAASLALSLVQALQNGKGGSHV